MDPRRARTVAPVVRGRRRALIEKGPPRRAFLMAGSEPATLDYFTSKSLLSTAWPLSRISTLYLPAGKPSGLEMKNALTVGPEGEIVRDVSSTTCPSWYVQRATSVAP